MNENGSILVCSANPMIVNSRKIVALVLFIIKIDFRKVTPGFIKFFNDRIISFQKHVFTYCNILQRC